MKVITQTIFAAILMFGLISCQQIPDINSSNSNVILQDVTNQFLDFDGDGLSEFILTEDLASCEGDGRVSAIQYNPQNPNGIINN